MAAGGLRPAGAVASCMGTSQLAPTVLNICNRLHKLRCRSSNERQMIATRTMNAAVCLHQKDTALAAHRATISAPGHAENVRCSTSDTAEPS